MTYKNITATRNRFLTDPSRPRYHYLPPANWINDPNGLIQFNGQYHLFYQYNPNGAWHSDMHWGHAVSEDLIHWQDLPIALTPTSGTYDEGGIFSGCAVNDEGVPTIFYTGVSSDYQIQVQCSATSEDNLLTWKKNPQNPIIENVPQEANQTNDFRDPFVWREDDTWYMLVGSRIKDVGGTVFLYRSSDLENWEYLNPLLVGDIKKYGAMWECPNFFQLGDKWVLIVSSNTNEITGDVMYFVGDYENYRFTPECEGYLDHAYLYAPLTLEDDQERRLLWGWVREGRTQDAYKQSGWAGAQSVPRVLSLDDHNRLNMQPIPELESIRQPIYHSENLALNGDIDLDVRGLSLDIVAEFDVNADSEIILSLACSVDGKNSTDIIYDTNEHQLIVNRSRTLGSSDDDRYEHRVEHKLDEDEALQLRILLDGSIIEIIANKRTSITSRIYPTDFDNNFVKLRGKNAIVRELSIYEMPSIWS